MTHSQEIRESHYQKVVYIDHAGKELVDLGALVPLIPEWVDIHAHPYFDDNVRKVKYVGDVGVQVWQTGSWPAWAEYDLENRLFIPVVFSMKGLMYVVRTDEPITRSEHGEYLVHADPMVLDVEGGDRLANADLFALFYHVPKSEYLLPLQAAALRKHPPISLDLVRVAGLDPATITVLGGRRLRGEKAGATVFRARPLNDLDLIAFDYLLGEDEGRLFLSHLPHRVKSLKAAYKALCPIPPRLLDEAQRQGEWWFTEADPDDIGEHGRPSGQYLRSSNVRAKPLSKKERHRMAVYTPVALQPEHGFSGTYAGRLARLLPDCDHFAQEVVRSPEGYVWARGWVKHINHDHESITLEGWHLVLHNGQIQAWSAPAARRMKRR